MNIGEFIKKRRKENKLTLRELGEITGLSHSYLSQIESGTRNASPEVLEKISKALDINYTELMEFGGFLHKKENTKETFEDIFSNYEVGKNLIEVIDSFNKNFEIFSKFRDMQEYFNSGESVENTNQVPWNETYRTEKDIAYQLNVIKEELVRSNQLYFEGQPMNEKAKISLIEFLELAYKQTQRINNDASENPDK